MSGLLTRFLEKPHAPATIGLLRHYQPVGAAMTRKILVLLEGRDSLEDIVLHLEKLARPGAQVVFLVRYPVSGFLEWLRDHSVATDSAREAIRAGRRISEIYSLDAQRPLAEQRVSPVREALRKKGVRTTVEVRPGPWNRVVQGYVDRGDVDLVMVEPRASLKTILGWVVLSSPWPARRGSAPLLLFNPERGAGAWEIAYRAATHNENGTATTATPLATDSWHLKLPPSRAAPLPGRA